MECLIACRDYPNCECGRDGREIEEEDYEGFTDDLTDLYDSWSDDE